MDEIDPIIEHIAKMDARIPGPGIRAEHIWSILRTEHPELTTWDLVCFAVNILGFLSPEFPWLHDSARQICSLVYKAHYLNGDKLDTSSTIVTTDTGSIKDALPRFDEESSSSE